MTEAEWLASDDPNGMLDALLTQKGMPFDLQPSDRKLRLFACACCRRVWDKLIDEASRHAVEAAERFADGEIDETGLHVAGRDASRVRSCEWRHSFTEGNTPAKMAYNVATRAIRGVAKLCVGQTKWPSPELFRAAQVGLLRDIFGNPFHPVWAEWNWLTPNVVGVAQAIYDERAFDRLPILADALEEAGCTNPDVLNHCRQPGEHVRGCWVVDLLLGKG